MSWQGETSLPHGAEVSKAVGSGMGTTGATAPDLCAVKRFQCLCPGESWCSARLCSRLSSQPSSGLKGQVCIAASLIAGLSKEVELTTFDFKSPEQR